MLGWEWMGVSGCAWVGVDGSEWGCLDGSEWLCLGGSWMRTSESCGVEYELGGHGMVN